jgi:hypothetical protein
VIINVLINQQSLFLPNAATPQLHQVSMLHPTYQNNFIQKLVHSLLRIDVKLFHSNNILVGEYTLQEKAVSLEQYYFNNDSIRTLKWESHRETSTDVQLKSNNVIATEVCDHHLKILR